MKPILFNTYMVRAILEGRKRVTRRAVKPQPNNPQFNCVVDPLDFGWYDFVPHGMPEKIHCPYRLNDILYVRETWARVCDGGYIYRADDKLADLPSFQNSTKLIYSPSIHMPREAARIFLRVTNVSVAKLQEIDWRECLAEGVLRTRSNPPEDEIQANQWKLDFYRMWNSTIKKADRARYGWEANPWVWVIKFERCDRPEIVSNA